MDSPCSTKKKGPLIHQTPSPQIKKRSSSSSSQETFPSPPPTSQTSSEICEREEMLNEIVSLERNYIRDLTVLIKVFRDPLKKSGFLKARDVIKIFRDPENIREMNRSFLTELEAEIGKCDRPRDAMVGPIFEKYSKIFGMYYDFIRDHQASEKLLDDKIARDADLRHAFKTASRTRPEARNMPVRFLIIFLSFLPQNSNSNNTGPKLSHHARSADSEIRDSSATTIGIYPEISSRS